jgi:hypothetical protein
MNRTTARRTAPALVALALALVVGGCSGDSAEETPTAGASANAELCSSFSELQTSVDDLRAEPIDLTGTPEEVAAKVAALGVKAATVKDNLGKVSALSDGPLGEAVGVMNMKADALSESLTLAVAEGQEEIGPKVTAAQEELTTAFADVTTKAEAVCPPS